MTVTIKMITVLSKTVLFPKNICTYRYLTNNRRNSSFEPIDMAYELYETANKNSKTAPLIILHGLFGSKTNWSSTSLFFSKNTKPERNVFAVDVRNHGESPHSPYHTYNHLSEDIKMFMEKLQIDKSVLMGHSMGGRGVMYFALKYPQKVEKLISVDSSPTEISAAMESVSSVLNVLRNVKFPKNVTKKNAKNSAFNQLSKFIRSREVKNFLLDNLIEQDNGKFTWRANISALVKNKSHIFSFPDTKGLLYDGPTLFVTGARSNFVEESDFPLIYKLFPNVTIKIVKNAGHWVHIDNPAEFRKICIDFLNK